MNRPPHQSNRLVLFENRWLEQFTVISVGWFVAIWAVIVPLVVMAAWGTFSPLSAIGLMLAGWFIWSIFEYIAHRKLFHFDTDRPWLERVVFIIHGNHHVQPRDELRNLMPPIVSVPVSMSIWALLWAMAGDAGTWMFVGFIGGSYSLCVSSLAHAWTSGHVLQTPSHAAPLHNRARQFRHHGNLLGLCVRHARCSVGRDQAQG